MEPWKMFFTMLFKDPIRPSRKIKIMTHICGTGFYFGTLDYMGLEINAHHTFQIYI